VTSSEARTPQDASGVPADRLWRVHATLGLPVLMVGVGGAEGGFPARLERRRRIDARRETDVGGLRFSLEPRPQEEEGELEVCEIATKISAPRAAQAAEAAVAAFQIIADDLAFQLHQPVRLTQVEALDVTEPVRLGDQREISFFPNGYPTWRFGSSLALGSVATVASPILRQSYAPLDGASQRAFDWYLKALHATLDVDRFIILWIVLEILLDSTSALVTGPYVNQRCGHEIANCPQCEAPTEGPQRGRSIRALLEKLGVAGSDAKDLWDMRQMLHGARALDKHALLELPRLLQHLQAAVGTQVKATLGYAQDDPPFLGAGAPAVMMGPGLGGFRALTAADLES